MKKVALINPGKNQEFGDNEPLSLACLAAYLNAGGIDVKIIDELAGDNVKEELEKYAPDLVGVTATTPLAMDAYLILDYARSKGYKTVIGGVHASVLPDEAASHADHVVIGEGEKVLLDIVSGAQTGRIVKGAYTENIDDIPPPARNLLNMEYYVGKRGRMPTAHLFFLQPGARLASMITSRGCPFSCMFCHNSWKGLPVRYNSPERVMAEISELKEKYRVSAIFFMDDDFFVNKARFKAICSALIESRMNIFWAANARVTSVSPETLALAKKAGCRQISFGFESGSQKILDILEKRSTVEQGEAAVKMTKEAGLLVYGTFMIGNPTETRQDMQLTENFILRNKIDSIGIGITTPYPGTKLWDWCQERKLIPEKINWSDFNMESCPAPANELYPKQEIERIRSGIVMKSIFSRKLYFVGFYLKALFTHPVALAKKFGAVFLPLISGKRAKK